MTQTENIVKQVIVLRKDLNMRKGKMIAQGAHASMGALLAGAYKQESDISNEGMLSIPMDRDINSWLTGKFTKIALGVDSEEELFELNKLATDMDVRHYLVQDSGVTEFNGVPTYTAIAIGPAENEIIDKITGQLKLL